MFSHGGMFFGTRMDTDIHGFCHADEFSLNTNRSNITNLPCGWVFYSPTDGTDEHRFTMRMSIFLAHGWTRIDTDFAMRMSVSLNTN